MLTRSNIRNYFPAFPTIYMPKMSTYQQQNTMAFTKISSLAILESHSYLTLLTKVPAWAYVSTRYSGEE